MVAVGHRKQKNFNRLFRWCIFNRARAHGPIGLEIGSVIANYERRSSRYSELAFKRRCLKVDL